MTVRYWKLKQSKTRGFSYDVYVADQLAGHIRSEYQGFSNYAWYPFDASGKRIPEWCSGQVSAAASVAEAFVKKHPEYTPAEQQACEGTMVPSFRSLSGELEQTIGPACYNPPVTTYRGHHFCKRHAKMAAERYMSWA